MAKIYLSPSDQRANTYGYGNTNEAVQCGYIAEACRRALVRSGQEVMVGHYKTMAEKCREADAWGADLYGPIHTNAFEEEDGKHEVMGTRIFSYDTKGKGWQYAQEVFKVLAPLSPGTSENVKAAPHLFEVSTPKAPTVYTECEFHDAPDGAKWIIENTTEIGEALLRGYSSPLGEKFVPAGSAVVDGGYVSMADYMALKNELKAEKVKAAEELAAADACIERVRSALKAYDNGKD